MENLEQSRKRQNSNKKNKANDDKRTCGLNLGDGSRQLACRVWGAAKFKIIK